MATIKDIAQLAGVAQGTVSNVLNGRGNVSSEKIRRVEEAALQLNYTINRNARMLRKGSTNVLAVLLPNLSNRMYLDFYQSFQYYAEQHGHTARLFLTDDIPERELAHLDLIRAEMMAGVVSVTCLTEGENPYRRVGLEAGQVLFCERRPPFVDNYIGYDLAACGEAFAAIAEDRGYRNVAILIEKHAYASQRELIEGFQRAQPRDCAMQCFSTDALRCQSGALQMFMSDTVPEAIFVANDQLARIVYNISENFLSAQKPVIYGLSALSTFPEKGFHRLELNYRLLGKNAAETLLRTLEGGAPGPLDICLPPEDVRKERWKTHQPKSDTELVIATLDSPTARIMSFISNMYTKLTGIRIRVNVYSYEAIHQIFSSLDEMSQFDIIRMDSTWMNWFAERVFRPLEEIDPKIGEAFTDFFPELMAQYTWVRGRAYALPETPSAQMLFYRKDLFDSIILRRLYAEQYKQELAPPRTFTEFNRIARFFTRKFNPASPVTYGTTLTLGNGGTSATEFMTRYFSHTTQMYDEKGQNLFNSAIGVKALEELLEVCKYANPQENSWWRQTAREFAGGDVAMTVLFSNYASELLHTNSAVIGKVGYAMVPGQNPLLGGGSIGVCRFSEHPVEALDFIRWMCREEVSTGMTLLGSVSPCIKTYDNYEVIDTYPWLSMAKECFAVSHIERFPPNTDEPFDEKRYLNILGNAVYMTCNNDIAPQAALDMAMRDYLRAFSKSAT